MRNQSFKPIKIFDKFLSFYRYSRVFKGLRNLSKPLKIYDLGCGDGKLVEILRKQGFDVKGVDLNANDNIIKADLNLPLPIEDNSADVIISLANIEHLSEPLLNLQEINRILKPGGKLILTTPSLKAKPILEFLAFTIKIIDEREILDHKYYFTTETLAHAAQSSGFTNFKIKTFQLGLNLHLVASK